MGKTIYANQPTVADLLPPPDFEAHEPWKLRKDMVDSLADPRTPAIAWRYLPMTDLNPGRDAAASGSVEESTKLAAAVKSCYSERGIWFDDAAFDRGVALRPTMQRGD